MLFTCIVYLLSDHRQLHFICDPRMSANDPLVKSAILAAKQKHMSLTKEETEGVRKENAALEVRHYSRAIATSLQPEPGYRYITHYRRAKATSLQPGYSYVTTATSLQPEPGYRYITHYRRATATSLQPGYRYVTTAGLQLRHYSLSQATGTSLTTAGLQLRHYSQATGMSLTTAKGARFANNT